MPRLSYGVLAGAAAGSGLGIAILYDFEMVKSLFYRNVGVISAEAYSVLVALFFVSVCMSRAEREKFLCTMLMTCNIILGPYLLARQTFAYFGA